MLSSSMICTQNQKKGDVERTYSRWVKVGGLITNWPNQLTKSDDLSRTLQPLFQWTPKSLQSPRFINPLSLSQHQSQTSA
jgi:hypothetical protein